MLKIRYFTIAQYNQEEQWLEQMAAKGLFLEKSLLPCLYIFREGKPTKMVYRFDFMTDKTQEKDITSLYEDYGWEQIPSVNGFLLFAKPAANLDPEDRELFNTSQSRLDMISRIMKQRMLPLLALCGILIVTCALQIWRYNQGQIDLASLAISLGCTLAVSVVVLPTFISLHKLEIQNRSQ